MSAVKASLAEYLRDRVRWREQQAAERPDDRARNQRAARTLEDLAVYVEQLPDDDPDLRAIARLHAQDVFTPWSERTDREVSSFGFDYEEREADFRGFLGRIVREEASAAEAAKEEAEWDDDDAYF